jgi:hypothetical protein
MPLGRARSGQLAKLVDGPCAIAHRTDDHDKLRRGQVQRQHFFIKRCKERIARLADQVAKLSIFQLFFNSSIKQTSEATLRYGSFGIYCLGKR